MRLWARIAALGALSLGLFGAAAQAQTNTCYSYDGLGRVTSASYGNGMTASYIYDSAGNRIQQTTSMVSDNFGTGPGSDMLIENTSGSVDIGAWTGSSLVFTNVSGLGSEWSFKGNGNFLGGGQAQFMLENTSGSVAVGQIVQTKSGSTITTTTNYTTVATLGSEWKFVGVGNFLGHCVTDFLIENTSGVVSVGEVVNGSATFSQIASLGSEWSFEGTGYFLGDGKPGFVIANTSGTIDVGELVNGSASYTQIGSLPSGYTFAGAGNYQGGSTTEILVCSASGATCSASDVVAVGKVVNGQLSFTTVTSLTGWNIRGSGDFLGVGHDQFLIENGSGAVYAADCITGTCAFTSLTSLGSEWSFHQ